MSSNFGQIGAGTAELAALERLKNRSMMLSTLWRLHLNWIFFILAGNEHNHNISEEFEIRPD